MRIILFRCDCCDKLIERNLSDCEPKIIGDILKYTTIATCPDCHLTSKMTDTGEYDTTKGPEHMFNAIILKRMEQNRNAVTKETAEEFINLGKKRINKWFEEHNDQLEYDCQTKFENAFLRRPLSNPDNSVTLFSMMTSQKTLEMNYKACGTAIIAANIDDKCFAVLTDDDNWYASGYSINILNELHTYFDEKIKKFFNNIKVNAEIDHEKSNWGRKSYYKEWKLTLK